jgi:hypothetical protein
MDHGTQFVVDTLSLSNTPLRKLLRPLQTASKAAQVVIQLKRVEEGIERTGCRLTGRR